MSNDLNLPFIKTILATDQRALRDATAGNLPAHPADVPASVKFDPSVIPYMSPDSIRTAMSDERYRTDPAFRAEVFARLAVSDNLDMGLAFERFNTGGADVVHNLTVTEADAPYAGQDELHADMGSSLYASPSPAGEAFRARVARRLSVSAF